MQQLKDTILQLFLQLEEVLGQLSDEQYNTRIASLSGATIGQHYRHVIECYQELLKGYELGYVNYDRRKRDLRLETNRRLVLRQMALTGDSLEMPERQLVLVEALGENTHMEVPSSYYRELIHNLDHTIHHMALIRIGIEATAAIRVPEKFGVAWSTIKYRQNRSI